MAGFQDAAPTTAPEEAVPPEAGEEAPNVSPEEQQVYDDVVTRTMSLLFQGDSDEDAAVRPGILEMLREDDDPKEAVAQVAAMVFGRVVQAAEEGGVEIPDDVREAAGAEVFEVVADIATNAGIYDFEADDQAFQEAWLMAVDAFRQQMQEAGLVDEEAEKASFAELNAMDQDGRLARMMAELGGAA